jgi:hypothetical protein
MDFDLKEQLINTIMKTFAYNKEQAENIFVELMNCVSNKDYVNVIDLKMFFFTVFFMFILRFQYIN